MEFDYSNLLVIEIPFKNKKSKNNYRYQGTAYYIYDKKRKDLICNFAQYEGEIFGAENWHPDYRAKTNPTLNRPTGYPIRSYKFRMELFGYGTYIKGKKKPINMTYKLNEINTIALKMSVLTSVGFIIGANSTGAKKLWKNTQILSNDSIYNGMRFASWFSNSFYNNNLNRFDIPKKVLSGNIKKIDLMDFIFTYCKTKKTSSWSSKENKIINLFYTMNYDYLSMDDNWKEFKNIELDKELIPTNDIHPEKLLELFNSIRVFDIQKAKTILRSKFRSNSLHYWMKKGLTKDFLTKQWDINTCDAAHIIEVRSVNQKINNGTLTSKDVERLVDKKNSLFLDKQTHSMWDKEKFEIDINGRVKIIDNNIVPQIYNNYKLSNIVISDKKVREYIDIRNKSKK